MANMFEDDPEPLDENDPEVKEELFQTMKHMGTNPSELKDPVEAAEYAEWLGKSGTLIEND